MMRQKDEEVEAEGAAGGEGTCVPAATVVISLQMSVIIGVADVGVCSVADRSWSGSNGCSRGR